MYFHRSRHLLKLRIAILYNVYLLTKKRKTWYFHLVKLWEPWHFEIKSCLDSYLNLVKIHMFFVSIKLNFDKSSYVCCDINIDFWEICISWNWEIVHIITLRWRSRLSWAVKVIKSIRFSFVSNDQYIECLDHRPYGIIIFYKLLSSVHITFNFKVQRYF